MVTFPFSRTRKILTFSSPRARKPTSLSSLAVGSLFLSLALALACSLYLLSSRTPSKTDLSLEFSSFTGVCDVFDGNWVRDESYPLYNSSLCPFAERGFNCLANGRSDTNYLRWRWKPRGCDVPRFDVNTILERLRGKRVVFVGDSMSRTQWESMICMLMTGVKDSNEVYEVNGNGISKTIRFLGVRFRNFNLSIEFFRSVFLVQQGASPRHGPRRVKSTLRLDMLDDINYKWVDADVLVFNSGHWWTPVKLFDIGCYFQVGGSLKLGMPINAAFRIALETWAEWVETMIDKNRTQVFFRTFEPSHWSSETGHKVCEVTQQPMPDANGNDQHEYSDILADVVEKMKVPATVLNVTSMGAYRSDAHIGSWSHQPSIVDCSHWCLPGVPDAWNELVFSYLLSN